MPDAVTALEDAERVLREVVLAWNTAEGRRGRIGENRRHVSKQQSELETQKESLRQEQWKLKKESSAFQHARDEAVALGKQVESLRTERDGLQRRLRSILSKAKALGAELRR